LSNKKIYSFEDNNVYIAKKGMVAVFFLSLLLILSLSVSAHNVRFNATADSYVEQSSPSTNYGSSASLQVKGSLFSGKTIFVEFDLSSIPSDAVVNSAKLYLYMYQAPLLSRDYHIYQVKSSWSESSITYNNLPSIGSDIGFLMSSNVSNIWLSWDIASDLQDIIDGEYTNHGYAVSDEKTGGGPVGYFASRENITHTPYLVVNYTVDDEESMCSIDYLENKDSGNNYNFTSPIYVNEDGKFIIYGSAKDNESKIVNVQYNRTSPDLYLSWTDADPVDGLFNELSEEWKSDPNDASFIEGWHEICCRAADNAGNVQDPGNCEEFCIDVEDPVMDSISDNTYDCDGDEETHYWNQQYITWNWTAHDEGCAGIDYYIVKFLEQAGLILLH